LGIRPHLAMRNLWRILEDPNFSKAKPGVQEEYNEN
jgi:hypothetical protein